MHPTTSSQTVCMPAGQAYKIQGFANPACTLPTGNPATNGAGSATGNMGSTTGQTGSARGIAIGSVLWYLISFMINYVV